MNVNLLRRFLCNDQVREKYVIANKSVFDLRQKTLGHCLISDLHNSLLVVLHFHQRKFNFIRNSSWRQFRKPLEAVHVLLYKTCYWSIKNVKLKSNP